MKTRLIRVGDGDDAMVSASNADEVAWDGECGGHRTAEAAMNPCRKLQLPSTSPKEGPTVVDERV